MHLYLLYFSLGLYLTAGVAYLLQFIFETRLLLRSASQLAVAGWCLQSVMLVLHFRQTGKPFLTDSFTSYSFAAWVIAASFLLLNRKYQLGLVGAFALPLISVFYLLSLFSSEDYQTSSVVTQSPWASVHIIFSFLSLAILSMSFILGVIFILEEFQLKYKVSPKIFLKLPSLQAMEQMHAKALTVGFILLSGGIITGAVWAKSVTGFYFFEDPRQLWAISAWLIYVLFLHARFAVGWRGRRGVLLSLIGFAVILFTFLGVKHH